jgi:CarD family transcriptional regulator
MYGMGEFVVHPGQGVCRVQDVSNDTYKLLPVHGRNPLLIAYPRASEDKLRPVLSQGEALSLIEQYPLMEPDEFHDSSLLLEEKHFKNVIKHGTCEDVLRTAKTFRLRIAEVKARNKKAPVVYERLFKEARTRTLEEMMCALSESMEQVEARFTAVLQP